MKASKLDLIISQIIELSLEETSNDPVRNIHSVTIVLNNMIESIMKDIREQERKCASTHSQTT